MVMKKAIAFWALMTMILTSCASSGAAQTTQEENSKAESIQAETAQAETVEADTAQAESALEGLSQVDSVKEEDVPSSEKEKIRVLILPKFEIDEMAGDTPGEAQYYYEAYEQGALEYEIEGGFPSSVLYVKDGVAMYVTGMGKVNAALSLMAVLSDDRFDFSDTYVISTGCMGTATEYSVMGDVFIATAAVDYDLGHHADIRDMSEERETTWFRDSSYDDSAVKILDADLMDQVYNLVKDIPLETTETTRMFMLKSFEGAEWAGRDPKVLRGTVVTGDNYWKGQYDEANARLITQSYNCPDPYAGSEMEDIALASAMERMGMLDRFIIIRDSVNMDVFMDGVGPEDLWGEDVLLSEDEDESGDIFVIAMENNYKVGSKIIDAILDGSIS